jgi:hypothetical protein
MDSDYEALQSAIAPAHGCRHPRETMVTTTGMNEIIARRIGRTVFGGMLFAGILALAMAGASWSYDTGTLHAARLIMATWLCAGLAGWIARMIAQRLPLSGSADHLLIRSVVLPAAGMALLLPLTFHMPVVLLISDGEGFDVWVAVSLWITGVPHLVFAATWSVRIYRLATGKPALSPGTIFLSTVLASCVPFILLYAIPPALVALTAVPCMGVMYMLEGIVERERVHSAVLPHALPRAIVASDLA